MADRDEQRVGEGGSGSQRAGSRGKPEGAEPEADAPGEREPNGAEHEGAIPAGGSPGASTADSTADGAVDVAVRVAVHGAAHAAVNGPVNTVGNGGGDGANQRGGLAPAVSLAAPGGEPAGASARDAEAGMDLLYDIELDATLQFGAREMPLRELLELGPGDVVELDRHVSEPVDLLVGNRIVARGEVVIASGNFALRITEVAAPQLRLESVRCLF